MTEEQIQQGCPNCLVPGTDGIMPIVAFNGPIRPYHSSEIGATYDYTTPDYLHERYFKLIADCGINLVTHFEHDYSKYPEDMIKVLEWAEQYNFKIFVNDEGLFADMGEEELTNRIAEYGHYKSFGGIKIIDEPCNDKFPVNFDGEQKLWVHPMRNYAPLARKLNGYKNLIGYINLLPYYYWMESTIEDYKGYVEEYLETCNPKIISYDHYPFDYLEREAAMKVFFENLVIIRGYAKKYNIPFWAFAQCGSQWNFQGKPVDSQEYRPTKWEFFWSVNTELAFGAKGIEYYPLVQPYGDALYLGGGLDCDRGSILGADGEPTMWYGFVRQINRHINAVGSVLLRSENVGIIAVADALKYTSGLDGILDTESYRELISVETEAEGAFIGCFDYEGKTAFYVVNNGTRKCQHIVLHFDDVYCLKLMSAVRNDTEQTACCQLTLGAGSAVLVIVSKE